MLLRQIADEKLAQYAYLLVDEEGLEEAVRDLVRIGIDRIEGWAPPAVLAELAGLGMPLARIESIGFAELERRRARGDAAVLDVRGRAELAAGKVPGSIQIAHTRLAAELDRVPVGEVYVYCASGARAAASASLLARAGRRAVHVDGVVAEWLAGSREAAAR